MSGCKEGDQAGLGRDGSRREAGQVDLNPGGYIELSKVPTAHLCAARVGMMRPAISAIHAALRRCVLLKNRPLNL